MKTERTEPEAIRVETALSRFPIHRLARSGAVRIELHEEDPRGATTLKWRVSHNSEFGQPGPLAYRLDTLIVNRRIEEATRPIPRIIKLGSLSEASRGLGLADSGKNRNDIKRALHQNASAYITAKIRYKGHDGTERALEAGFTRYNVVFVGEKLPDGRTADAVYLVLSDIFMQVIDGARTRPLDYDYLKQLPPTSQRFYELASYAMYAALKNDRPRARLAYSEFCTYAPQSRCLEYGRMKQQMWRVHAPHRRAGYIGEVGYEATTDQDGRPDWLMLYTPGPKAKAEFRAFTQRAKLPEPEPEPTGLEQELTVRGVMAAAARDLVRDFPEDRIKAQIERLDWLREREPGKVKDAGGYLADAIRRDYAPPAGFRSKAERRPHEEARREQQRREEEARRAKALEREAEARIAAYWDSLTPEQQARLEAEALEQAEPDARAGYEEVPPIMRKAYLRSLREVHIRRLLGLPAAS